MMGKRPNYQSLYDDMIAQRNTALARVALLEDEIANYWEPANAAAIARAAAAEADLRELRENVMLGLGMAADDVAAVDDELADTTIAYLLAGHKELARDLRHMTEERDTISSAWDKLHAELTTARAQLAAANDAPLYRVSFVSGFSDDLKSWLINAPDSKSAEAVVTSLIYGATVKTIELVTVWRPAPPRE